MKAIGTRSFAAPAYFLAILLVLLPPAEVAFNVSTYEPGVVRWRFGFVGLVTSAALLPLVGVLVGAITAHLADHRWGRVAWRALAVVGMLAAGAALGLFALDSLQVRREVRPELTPRFDIAVYKTLVAQLLLLLALGSILLASIRADRGQRRRHGARAAAAPARPARLRPPTAHVLPVDPLLQSRNT